jgi:hypothetical protein
MNMPARLMRDWATSALGLLTLACPIEAQESAAPQSDSRYVRVTFDDEKNPIALQTSIVRLLPETEKTGVTVDLVSAVHLGEKSYYQALNRLFADYDVVLYELVAPEGMEVPQPDEDANPMRIMHRMMQTMLGLSSQLEEVDYTRGNFVHADMSPTEISAAMKARGDSALTFALSALADILRQANIQAQEMEAESEQPTITQQDILSFFTDADGGSDLKKQMALQFHRMGGSGMALGPTIGKLLVSDRNAAAMRVFQRELASGRKKIAIFYGAAHMPDFAERLQEDFGLVRSDTRWVTAWDLTAPAEVDQVSPLNVFLKLLQSN